MYNDKVGNAMDYGLRTMLNLTINGEDRTLADHLTLAELVERLGYDRRRVAVEVNKEVIPQAQHGEHRLAGGGSLTVPNDKPLVIGKFSFQSRLITGTGKYASYELMRDCLAASACEVTTVAVRRERLVDKQGRNILDYLDLKRYTILPNTAGCFSAEDAVRHARLARELLTNLDNPGADWVKLECLGDPKTLLPDPLATLEATKTLVKEGFQVLVYTSDDPIMARRLKAAGAASVMPAGSPIGSGQGILNANSMRIILEFLKEGDPDYPVIVDAGVGTASDITVAMELGCDGVLLNTGIAHARGPLRMTHAM